MERDDMQNRVKRKRSQSPPRWGQRGRPDETTSTYSHRPAYVQPKPRSIPQDEQVRLNKIQEDERMREWAAQEDNFVLKQAKRKAAIRVKESRARPIDWLAVLLRVIDPTKEVIDNEIEDEELEFVDPQGVFDSMSGSALSELGKDIDTYLHLETNRKNREYWQTMQTICKDRKKRSQSNGLESRATNSVSSDIDKLLAPKSFEELGSLEKQIENKLASNEPVDTDYWQQLLDSLLVWKARAKLRLVYKDVINTRMVKVRRRNEQEALSAQRTFQKTSEMTPMDSARPNYCKTFDPDPLLQLPAKDKSLEVVDESTFLARLTDDRGKVAQLGYIPDQQPVSNKSSEGPPKPELNPGITTTSARFFPAHRDDISQATRTLYDREVARGVGEDEEVFSGEEEVETRNKDLWMGKYRPRKPKYFNRVQMGYEWNKYNQTHYDHDNPPPKVVQGYKFHIFYPDLIDRTKAPTYKILREGGRKKGQSSAPAGEEDTCIIRFDSGPPYESVAFKIVDRDWDYSAKHDRGFKSAFEKGILTLHFSFKKIYYRK